MQENTLPDGRLQVVMNSGHAFELPMLPELDRDESSAIIFRATAGIISELSAEMKAVDRDETLSDIGKQQRLDPLREKAVTAVAASWANLAPFEKHLDEREAALLAVPQVDASHAAAAIEDREIRDWWRSLPTDERLKMLEKVTTEPGHERIELALLRSPIALADHETRAIREAWDKARRLENPAEALAIDAGRRALDWSRQGLAHVAGIAAAVTGWQPERVLRAVRSSPEDHIRRGATAWGFGPMELADMDRRIAARKAA